MRPFLVLAALLVALLSGSAAPGSAIEVQGSAPLLLAHYYAWYDMNTWISGSTADLPVDPYLSGDPATMERHIAQAQDAGIDAFNLAWLGPGNPTDTNLARILPIAASRGFAISLGVETDSPFLSTQGDVAAALQYALATHAQQPGYLWHEGKPVIFFWRLGQIGLEGASSPVEAWRSVRDEVDPYRESLWIGEGDRFEFLQVFDGIHPYSIAWAPNVARTLSSYATQTRQQGETLGSPKLWIATVMPGYDDTGTGRPDAFARDRGDSAFYEETWEAALATSPDWIIITSWNEWVEGSQIEPSPSYGDLYLQVTRNYADRWKGLALVA